MPLLAVVLLSTTFVVSVQSFSFLPAVSSEKQVIRSGRQAHRTEQGSENKLSRPSTSLYGTYEKKDPIVRQWIGGIASSLLKQAATQKADDPSLSPLWNAVNRLDGDEVRRLLSQRQVLIDTDERNPEGDTPLLYIARKGHYKYPPEEIPLALIDAGADMEARSRSDGLTALQISLKSGWQNIAEVLLQNGARSDPKQVEPIRDQITCPDCKTIAKRLETQTD
uniref:Uncharacterized protein n=1 Tax=Chromera velia CCMP2878 TaxID=1169474 RepID=A0A0G4HAN4_9ALVE|mmetsp:Transcript_36670/g.72123  ORF Transcript_36670/g.72123 Transcript_36670/m.72123 type:complete len:223 (+) Transcript_36670:418-1086(+)|eukprot:Cvel_25709.t1-p1 / transcript=Cvel_25709.t1 / gene=Cvel_25709 / organism=Chromera_velia_CCMP2878 / gene_product=hypothetical protein / transcript_product=hypothetical protein / location=Cvel_scaffold2951:376-1041(-) / protein_length=222 / sequence_SO=supercontig / SO=protein_coding / is_pseudo=false